MKTKTTLLCAILFAVLFTNSAYAQPVIDSNWFYNIGDTIRTDYFTPNSYPLPQEGFGVPWDMSDLTGARSQRETIFVDPSELPYADEFPDANIGYRATRGREFFLKKTEDKVQLLGMRSEDARIEYSQGYPTLMYDNFEFGQIHENTYLRLYTNLMTSDTTMSQESDSLQYVGVGIVITPHGTYGDCVMTKLTKSSTIRASYVEYKIYQGSMSNLIARDRRYTSGGVEPVRHIEYISSPILSNTIEPLDGKIEVTGPLQDQLLIQSLAESDLRLRLTIIDMAGREVLAMSDVAINGRLELDIHQLEAAQNYALILVDKAEGAILVHKFLKR
ncbi:MAG: hypothetical protein AAFV95_27840 [Bacteroidota bacterium]